MNIYRAVAALCVVTFLVSAVEAQTLNVYDDALQNSFTDQSYVNAGSVDFNSTAQPRTGAKAIRFVGDNFGAVVFDRLAAANLSTATYPILRFWVHGGAAGGQQLRVLLRKDNVYFAPGADVDSYITGGAIAAGIFREVVINLTQPPFNADAFDRIEIQSDLLAAQPALFIDDVTLGQVAAPAAAPLQIAQNYNFANMLHERFIWRDSNNEVREAALAYNSGQIGVGNSRGGALRQFKYQLPNGTTRTAGLTGYGIGDYGFGYVVMHPTGSACLGGDSSPYGGGEPGNGFERVFEGRHHAIFRFRQNYPRICAANGGAAARSIPATIDWIFSTGRDNPAWAVTYDIDQTIPAPAAANMFNDDSRAPYGELAIDGDGFTAIDGVGWGDRYKFTNTTSPVTLDSAWTWNVPNTIPYVKEWLNAPLTVDNKRDATMGIVQTQTMAQQDAAGGRTGPPGTAGSMNSFWNMTSAAVGNACNNAGRVHAFPCADDWPYQANANSLDYEYGNAANPGKASVNARLTWKTQYGFIGQSNYTTYNGLVATAVGYPKKSYSTYIVLGTHSSGAVETQVSQVETIQSVTFTPAIGTVVTTGPAGVTRLDNVTYSPAGYNHVYGALALSAVGNQIDININVGAGTLRKPLIIISNYTAGDPQVVRYGGQALVADQDYFASPRPTASELWITLARDIVGAGNRLEITGGGLAAPASVSAYAASTTQVNISWVAVPGAANYEVHRSFDGSAYTLLMTVGGTTHSDMGLTPNTAYLYKVKTLGAGGPSPLSGADVATTILFTDDPINAGTTVKAVHITQLRTAAAAIRLSAGLGAQAFTDPALAAGTSIKAAHITDLRTAIDQARAAIVLQALVYVDPAIAAGVTVKAAHISNLRDGVK